MTVSDELRQRLERHLGGPVSGLADISAGWESDVFAFRYGGDDLVVRMYVGADGAEKGRREFTGMRLLADAGYPVPRVDEFVADTLGGPALLMECVPGDNPGRDEASATTCAGLLADLHDLDVAPFLDAFGIEAVSWPGREVERWRVALAPLELAGFGRALDWLEARVADLHHVPPSVVHWDFHPNNLLVAGSRVSVVDWTQVDVSDPRFDVAWTMLLGEGYGHDAWSAMFLDGYRQRRPAPDLDWFRAAACGKRLASIVVSLLAGPEALGMRPEAAGEMHDQLQPTARIYEELVRHTGVTVPEVERLLP